ncbi:MAG: hypothetical protein GYB36_14460 [Alphaproteobacteria bacterium]|nr:hypothetical protein [Alphaproteobacteria bacterium]
MIRHLIAGAASALVLTAAAPAQEIVGNVGLTTNYVFRGITQTDDGPAVSGGFDYENSGFYAGIWASSVDFGDDTTMEIDFYGGYGFIAAGLDWDLGAIYYAYPDSPEIAGNSQDFLEIYGAASKDFGSFAVDGKLSWSDDFYAGTGNAIYLEAGVTVPLTNDVAFDARIGSSQFDDQPGADYEDWQLGLSGELGGVGWDLRYHDTSDFYGDAFVFSIFQSFGG